MGHAASLGVYQRLKDRLDRHPIGAPGQTTIYEILRTLYSAEEAELAARLPIKPTSLPKLARQLGQPAGALQRRLETMAEKGLVLDLELGGQMHYLLPPTVVGLFEFTMMRAPDLSQRELAQLYHRYLVEEPDFANQLKPGTTVSPFRTAVHEEALPDECPEIIDWERATHLVSQARRIVAATCHCRHVAHHRGEDCALFRMEGSCLTLDQGADFLERHGYPLVPLERSQALELLAETRERGMVHIVDNVQRHPGFLCNCCGCCCELLQGFKRFRFFGEALSSNFVPHVEPERCNGCRDCTRACPVNAMDMHESLRAVDGRTLRFLAGCDPKTCLGCGVCALRCERKAIRMDPRPQRRIAPETTLARVLTMAIEQGKLKELLQDPDDSFSSRAAGALIGAILRLPPIQRLLVRDSFKSRFVGFVIGAARTAGVSGSDL